MTYTLARDLLMLAAPLGRTSGFGAAGDHTESFAVAVLPKVWRIGSPRVHRLVWPESGHLHLTLYEGDYLHLSGSEPQRTLVRLAMSSVGDNRVGEGLIEPVSAVPSDIDVTETAVVAALDDVLDLVEISERAKWSDQSGSVPSGHLPHPLLLLMLYRRFLNLTEPIIHHMRSRYRESEEHLATPRGRIADASLAEAQLGGPPVLSCRYDDLTVATDLAIVLLASTRLVATFSGPPVLAELVQPVRYRATRLVRHLNGIPIVDRTVAMRLANGLRLNRLEAMWTTVLELSCQILAGASTAPRPTVSHPMESMAFRIPMEAVWEGILRLVLEGVVERSALYAADGAKVKLAVEAPSPWGSRESTTAGRIIPDFVARIDSSRGSSLWVLDAKYKPLPVRLPSSDDANQLFVYSHLVRSDGRSVDRCALAFPILGETISPNAIQLWRKRDETIMLVLAGIPFPARVDLRFDGAWNTYLGRATVAVRDLLST